jgi:uncharacterized membrane protein YfcA
MATPLLLYVVGLQPHVAIGTGALAVSANAFVNFCGHLRVGNVRWRCSIVFSVVGVAGAIIGSLLGQQIDGKKLVFLFAILMIVVGVLMLRRKDTRGLDAPVSMSVPAISNSEPRNLLFLVGTAFAVGVLSGFFGIGGGFLIVPGLLLGNPPPRAAVTRGRGSGGRTSSSKVGGCRAGSAASRRSWKECRRAKPADRSR